MAAVATDCSDCSDGIRVQEIVRGAGQQRMYSMGKQTFERCAQLVAQAEDAVGKEMTDAPARDEWGRDVPVRLDNYTLFFPLTERATPSAKKEFDAAVTLAYAKCVLRRDGGAGHLKLADTANKLLVDVLRTWCVRHGWSYGLDLLLLFDGAAHTTLPQSLVDGSFNAPASVWPDVSFEIAFRFAHLKWAVDELHILLTHTMYAIEERLCRDSEADAERPWYFTAAELRDVVLPALRAVDPSVASVDADLAKPQSDLVIWGVWFRRRDPHTLEERITHGSVVKAVNNGIVQDKVGAPGGGGRESDAEGNAAQKDDSGGGGPRRPHANPPFYLTCVRKDPRSEHVDFRVRVALNVKTTTPDRGGRCGANVLGVRVLGVDNWRRQFVLANTSASCLVMGDMLVPNPHMLWQRDTDAHIRAVLRSVTTGRFDACAVTASAVRLLWTTLGVAIGEARRLTDVNMTHTVTPRQFSNCIQFVSTLFALGEDVPIMRNKNDTAPAFEHLILVVLSHVVWPVADPELRKLVRAKWASAALKVYTNILSDGLVT